MPPKARKKKNAPAVAGRIRRSTRPSRPPRRPDDEFSAVGVAIEEPVLPPTEVSLTHHEPFTANSVLDTAHLQLRIDGGGESDIGLERTMWVPLRSQRNLIIDPLGSYSGEVDPADPAADIIRQLLAILPAHTSIPGPETDEYGAGVEPLSVLPTHVPMPELESGAETHSAPELADRGQGDVAPMEITAQVPADIQQAHEMSEDAPTVLYYVGLISAPGQQTAFCVPGPVISPPTHRAGGIIDFLVFANGPAGRALENLSPVSQFRVGVSRVPEDINNDFMSFRTGFKEAGRLDSVVMAPADSARVLPARDSELRTALLLSLGLGENVSIFVLYVYPENTTPFAIQPVATPATVQPAIHPPTLAVAVSNPIDRYLDLHHAAKKAELRTLLDIQGYQSAYRHCLIERQVMSVCNSLGIVFSSRQIVAARVDFQASTIEIRPEDIATSDAQGRASSPRPARPGPMKPKPGQARQRA
ncbi:hypothetical protein B0H19DRAFT_1072843 [Mycena capillaripes]|nr:hypothetical protein B0H19DRAFT_1072843 [Mycena capillaripes]